MPSFLFSSRQVFTPQVPRPELGAIFRGHLCTRSKDSCSFLLSSPHGGCSQAWDLLACLEKCQVGGCTASPEHSAVPLPGSSSGDGGPQAHHTALTDPWPVPLGSLFQTCTQTVRPVCLAWWQLSWGQSHVAANVIKTEL